MYNIFWVSNFFLIVYGNHESTIYKMRTVISCKSKYFFLLIRVLEKSITVSQYRCFASTQLFPCNHQVLTTVDGRYSSWAIFYLESLHPEWSVLTRNYSLVYLFNIHALPASKFSIFYDRVVHSLQSLTIDL